MADEDNVRGNESVRGETARGTAHDAANPGTKRGGETEAIKKR